MTKHIEVLQMVADAEPVHVTVHVQKTILDPRVTVTGGTLLYRYPLFDDDIDSHEDWVRRNHPENKTEDSYGED